MYQEIKGNLITLAWKGQFDVITHGCNCFCKMGAGIAPQMAKAFGCDTYSLEAPKYKGDINKLGQIEWKVNTYTAGTGEFDFFEFDLAVVNSYTQYNYGRNHSDGVHKPIDYEALTLCLRKINIKFCHNKIGLPQIGCGLAGGDWKTVKNIIQRELKDCNTTVVIYK